MLDLTGATIDRDERRVDLTIAISLMNAYNRIAIGFRRLPAVTPAIRIRARFSVDRAGSAERGNRLLRVSYCIYTQYVQ